MARKRSIETIDVEIAKVMADMSKLQDRYESSLRNSRIFRNRNGGARRIPSRMPTLKVARVSRKS